MEYSAPVARGPVTEIVVGVGGSPYRADLLAGMSTVAAIEGTPQA